MKKTPMLIVGVIILTLQVAFADSIDVECANIFNSGPAYWSTQSDNYNVAVNYMGTRSALAMVFQKPDGIIRALYVSGVNSSEGRPMCSTDETGACRFEVTYAASDHPIPQEDIETPAFYQSEILYVPSMGQVFTNFPVSYDLNLHTEVLDFMNSSVPDGGYILIRIVPAENSGVFISEENGPMVIQYTLNETDDPNFFDTGYGPPSMILLSDPTGFDGVICRGAFEKEPFGTPMITMHLMTVAGLIVAEQTIFLPYSPSVIYGEFTIGIISSFSDLYPDGLRARAMGKGYRPTTSGDVRRLTLIQNRNTTP